MKTRSISKRILALSIGLIALTVGVGASVRIRQNVAFIERDAIPPSIGDGAGKAQSAETFIETVFAGAAPSEAERASPAVPASRAHLDFVTPPPRAAAHRPIQPQRQSESRPTS